jgi:hypothetical protein
MNACRGCRRTGLAFCTLLLHFLRFATSLLGTAVRELAARASANTKIGNPKDDGRAVQNPLSKTSFIFMPQQDDDMTLWQLLPVPCSTSVDDELMMIGPCTGCCISVSHDAIVEQNGKSFPSKR